MLFNIEKIPHIFIYDVVYYLNVFKNNLKAKKNNIIIYYTIWEQV